MLEEAAVFLASPLAAYVTGALLTLDGGTYLLPGSGLLSYRVQKAMAAAKDD